MRRFDPVRHAEKYPIPTAIWSGKRERSNIEKENNFKQPGERYRSFSRDSYILIPFRQDRFIKRCIEALSDPRVTYEISSFWISYWSRADKLLGQKLASRFSVRPSF